MWTVVILLLNVGALNCIVSSSPPSPTNVIFSSVNLKNVLQWFPGSGTPDDTRFTVQYAIYGDSVEGSKGKRVNWRAVRQCTDIVWSWCDLSHETWDLEQGYYARVRAVSQTEFSKWARTRTRFDPKTDTSFGPPLVSMEIKDNNAIITMKGPMRYQPEHHTPAAVSMATIYPQMIYNLSIYNTHRIQTHHFPVASSSYTYRLMDYDTRYCFSAKTILVYMPTQCQSSAWQCITTPQDPVIGQLQRVIVGIVVPTVCMCVMVVVGYILYSYLTGKGQKSPYILDPPSFHPPVLTFPPESPNLLVITIIKEVQPENIISDPTHPEQPQDIAQPPLLDRSEPWDDLAVDYGFVDAALKTAVRGEDGNNMKGECKEDDRKYPGLFISTKPQTGLLRLPLNQGEEMNRKVRVGTDGEIDGGVEERRNNEEAPLLSSYASQNTTYMPTSHPDRLDYLPNDYGFLRVATEEDDEEEEEQGGICIDWDPQTGKLVLPEMALKFNREGGSDGLMQGEKRMMGGEEESNVRLENVFVRQGSEERREMERGGGAGWEADNFLTKWNLVVSMDE